MTRRRLFLSIAHLSLGFSGSLLATTYFSENFEGLSSGLGPFTSASESGGDDTDWVNLTEAQALSELTGWTMTRGAGHDSTGVTEFDGWTFLDPVSWDATAGQDRANFTKGAGVIAVADSDEYDDSPAGGAFEASLSTPEIDISGAVANTLTLKFDSSWRAEPQVGTVTVSFDGGAPVEVLSYDGTTPTAYDDTVRIPLDNPAGASTVQVSWSKTGSNNWWWAIDNIEVADEEKFVTLQPTGGEVLAGNSFSFEAAGYPAPEAYQWFVNTGGGARAIPGAESATLTLDPAAIVDSGQYYCELTIGGETVSTESANLSVLAPTTTYFSEDFDSVGPHLGPFVSDTESGGDGTDWSSLENAQANGGLPGWSLSFGPGHQDGGPAEFNGWTFLDPASWDATAGQNRSAFTKGMNVVAVADSDEYDDSASAAFDASLTTPEIDISSAFPNSLTLEFDSSWNNEPQLGTVTVSYDGAPPIEVLRFDINTGDRLNEREQVALFNPAGASSMTVTFSKMGDNNWWWAIDNIEVLDGKYYFTQQPQAATETEGKALAFNAMAYGGQATYQWFFDDGSGPVPIANGTGSSIDRDNLLLEDAGQYYAVADFGPAGSIISEIVTLEVEDFVPSGTQYFSEDFNSLEGDLGPFVSTSESGGDGTDWTATLPVGWTQTFGDGHQEGGPAEFDGWTFLDPASWDATAGQDRALFSKGQNVVAVADSDEYDDINGSAFDATLTSPAIDVSAAAENSLTLVFDSSWRAEPQVGTITVSYDGGPEIEVLRFDGSSPSRLNHIELVPLFNPAGAQEMKISFRKVGDNNWWWAIDNISVVDGELFITEQPQGGEIFADNEFSLSVAAYPAEGAAFQWYDESGPLIDSGNISGTTASTLTISNATVDDSGSYYVEVSLGGNVVTSNEAPLIVVPLGSSNLVYYESFDSAPLGFPVQEPPFVDNVWTATPPAGWSVDHIDVAGIGDPDVGIEEWEGWTFADPDWWPLSDDQSRSQFTRGGCVIAIADPDEWDDIGSPGNDPVGGNFNTELISPAIDISGSEADTLFLRFASSWRPEDVQEAVVQVSYNGGSRETVLHWNSGADGAPGVFHPDAQNESVVIALDNPDAAGGGTMQIFFGMPKAANDWWWAIDNITVYTGLAPVDILVAPNSETVLAGGGDVSLNAVGEGIGPITYTWYQGVGTGRTPLTDNDVFSGTGTGTLTITAPGTEESGLYSVDISNPLGTVTTCARLNLQPVIFDLNLTDQIGEDAAVGGDLAFFDVKVFSWDPEIEFTWELFDEDTEQWEAIEGASNAGDASPNPDLITEFSATQPDPDGPYCVLLSLALGIGQGGVLPTEDPGTYRVIVGNQFGSVASNTSNLEVEGVVIVDNPEPMIVQEGVEVELAVLADSLESIDYQWFSGIDDPDTTEIDERMPIEGATSPILAFVAVSRFDDGYYSVDTTINDGTGMTTVTSDTVRLAVYVPPGNTKLFAENFEGLDLGPNVDESLAGEMVWTKTGPDGWTIDDTGVPGAGTADDGVTEWAGWSFADTQWWIDAADNQGRAGFAKSIGGTAAIVDPDEWDDGPHAAGTFNSDLFTPVIDLQGAQENSVAIQFDSSWRWEDFQAGGVEVSYDGGNFFRLLTLESVTSSPDFKLDNTNETISLPAFNPGGASTMQIKFTMYNAGNDWWWAIDNLCVTGDVAKIRLTDVSYDGAGNLSITWESAETGLYRIQSSTTGVAGSFMDVTDDISGAVGGSTTTTSVAVDPLAIPNLLIRVAQQ